VHRGQGFEEAFKEAKERLIELSDPRHGRLVYDLDEDDHILVEVWEARLTERGFAPKKAHDMAQDIVRLLRQLYLVEADKEFVDDFFCDYERDQRETVLARLGSTEEALEGQSCGFLTA